MWIFTTYGFFSVTESPEAAGVLQIRARDERDLKDLKRRHFLTSRIIETEHTDYRWRLLCSPAVFAEIMSKEVLDINYSNFKNAASQRQKARPLMAVWSAMASVQRNLEWEASQTKLPLFDEDDPVAIEQRREEEEGEEDPGFPDWTPPPPCDGKTFAMMQQEEAAEQLAAQKRQNPRKAKPKKKQTTRNPF